MFEALFGTEMPLLLKFVVAFLIVLGLIGGLAYVVRRFGSGALNSAAARGRQPRLAVIDAAPVDGRRRLVLIRRDNVEHLIMIGGPSDLVVEPNIVRAAPAAAGRETPPARAGGEVAPRAVALPEGNMWPLQPEPVSRPQRGPAIAEEPMWPPQSQPEPAPRAAGGDRLAGLASDLSRAAASGDHAPQPRDHAPRPVPAEIRRPAPATAAAPPPPPPPPQQTASDEQNLAEMAHRLEAALRRPIPPAVDAPPAEGALTKPVAEPIARPAAASDLAASLAPRPAAPPPASAEPARALPEKMPKVARPEPKPAAKSVYDSLEQEMASLLGRPSGKT